LNLVGDGGNSFGAEGSFSVVSELRVIDGIQKWRFKDVSLGALTLDVDQGAYSLKGSILKFDSDPLYGNGFKGEIEAKFSVGDNGITVNSSALFGNINDMRYWNIDALATFPTAIIVYPGFGIYGFGGGAYYHMKQTLGASHSLGTNASGITYVPDNDTYLGVKAMLKFGATPKKETFNGNITLEFSFNNSGGLNHISLYGNAEFMTKPFVTDATKLLDKTKKVTQLSETASELSLGVMNNKMTEFNQKIESLTKAGNISAKAFIQYDFTNKTLHASFDTYVNIAGGLVSGTGSGGLAGNATLHFAPNTWFVHIGKPVPGEYIGLRMLNLVNTNSYFMVGDNIPPLSPFPSNVRSIASNIARPTTNAQDLALGKGFSTGASISLSSAGRWAVFNYSVQAGIGFDLLVKHTPGVTCGNTTSYRGINGWYSEAQAYAYFNGQVGVTVKAFKKTHKFNILSLSAAAALQAKLPNPSWFNGDIAGGYSVLGGLFKGSFSKGVTFGQACSVVVETETQDSVDIKVIDKIETNSTNKDSVSIFASIKTQLNVEANISNQMELLVNSSVNTYTYKIELNKFEIKEANTNNPIAGRIEWDTNNRVAIFHPSQFMKTNTSYVVETEITFKKRSSSGGWQTLYLDGSPIQESLGYTFTTNKGDDIIEEENIAYIYPLVNQTNFYPNEYAQGFMKLNLSQEYLFQSNNHVYSVVWEDKDKNSFVSNDLSYNNQKNQLEYSIPTGLSNNKAYKIKFLKTSIADSVVSVLNEYYIRTSYYNSLQEKLQSFQYSSGWRYPLFNRVHEVGVTATGNELFDKVEMTGTSSMAKLITIEADLDSTNWYKQYIDSLLYMNYPLGSGVSITNRQVNEVGVPPVKTGLIRQKNYTFQLNENELKNESFPSNSGVNAFIFNTVIYAANDYADLHTQVARLYTNNPTGITPEMSYLLNTLFTPVQKGSYVLNVKYHLPNGEVTSHNKLTIYNPVE
jgi:hypothetical protein